MVETEGQPPICFDFNPPLNADLNLFSDPETGLVLTGNYLIFLLILNILIFSPKNFIFLDSTDK